ncbi:hypothetical protein LTR86_002666 [Recurvomyces mirabilis]|nr:hypothetical protein LTR86_002666 [Recurvomyces mirabilis]
MQYPWFAVSNQRNVKVMPPRLNAEGEAVWVYLEHRINSDRMKEVMAEDWPMVPTSVTVHEDPALLNAIHDLGPDWPQILVRMDPDVQNGSNYYQNACGNMRKLNGIATKGAVHPSKFTNPSNCARGLLPGIVDLTRPYGMEPPSNWIPFKPEKNTPVHRMNDLHRKHDQDQKAADRKIRAALIASQSSKPVVVLTPPLNHDGASQLYPSQMSLHPVVQTSQDPQQGVKRTATDAGYEQLSHQEDRSHLDPFAASTTTVSRKSENTRDAALQELVSTQERDDAVDDGFDNMSPVDELQQLVANLEHRPSGQEWDVIFAAASGHETAVPLQLQHDQRQESSMADTRQVTSGGLTTPPDGDDGMWAQFVQWPAELD